MFNNLTETVARRMCLLSLLAGLMIWLLSLSIRDVHAWPFASYALFKKNPSKEIRIERFQFVEEDGTLQNVRAFNALPIEYFRALHFTQRIYREGKNKVAQTAFAKRILERLNTRPWPEVDEIRAAVKPQSGGRFVGFKLYTDFFDLSANSGPTGASQIKDFSSLAPVRSQLIFTYPADSGDLK